MRAAALLVAAAPALAAVLPGIPGAHDVLEAVEHFLHPESTELLIVSHEYDAAGRRKKLCVLKASDGDDTDNVVDAVEKCGTDGIVRLPDAVYNISRPLEIELHNAVLDVHGWLTFSTDIEYWIAHRIPFEFQDQSLAFAISGDNFVVDGNDSGGIDGNGQVWYEYAKDFGNKFGRPMSLAIKKAKNVVVKNFSVVQPQFWAHITIEAENVLYKDCYVNATSTNPESKSDPKNWLQNTDGIDTWRSNNITIENWVYQGGDDCIALKPNSTNIFVKNATCWGGTGIAFGSIGQYPGVTDIIENVVMEDLALYPSSQCPGYQGVYFKSWVGVPYGSPPNGGGGGTGWCHNVTVRDVYMEDIWHPVVVDTSLTYTDSERGKHPDTGTFEWADIHLANFTGSAKMNRVVWADCSKARPCERWTFDGIDITPGKTDKPELAWVCNNFVLGGNDGLPQCHPSNSTDETDAGGTL
ncbi:hypothetical protein Q5752_006273 [Cryptotrichosporon argae]